jgi:hypothetical protein
MTKAHEPIFLSGIGGFEPLPTVTDHEGSPLDPDADFFQPPPADIGLVISAYTSLKKRTEAVALPARIALMTLALIPGIAFLCFMPKSKDLQASFGAIAAVVAICGIALVGRATRFSHACSYVGTRGAVRYRMRGSRNGQRREEGIRFAQAAELRLMTLITSPNSIHQDTRYQFDWTAADGRLIYQLRGYSYPANKAKRGGDPFLFGKAAEAAWSDYLAPIIQTQIDQQGFLKSAMGPGQWVQAGPQYIELADRNECARILLADIESFKLIKGTFWLIYRDPRCPDGKGTLHFKYSQLANARLFRQAVEKLMGMDV